LPKKRVFRRIKLVLLPFKRAERGERMKKLAILGFLVICGSVLGSEPNQGLIAHWKLDGNANDSVGSNHGTLMNGPAWTTAQIDGALSFDGFNDYVDCGNDSTLDITNSLTISAWVKLDTTVGNRLIVGKDDNTGGRAYDLYFLNSTEFGIEVHKTDTSSTRLDSGGLHPTTGQWCHVVGTYEYVADGTSIMKLYVNGTPDKNLSNAVGPIQATTAELNIGRRSFSGAEAYFNGTIDDVRIYNRALSAGEVRQLYGGELLGLEIVGPEEVAENSGAQYKAIAHYERADVDVTDSVQWYCEPNRFAQIDVNGTLTTEEIYQPQDITVYAQYTQSDVTVEAEKAVSIFAVCPSGSALQFDGVGDYVEVTSSPSLDLHGGLTLTAWVKNDSDNDGQLVWRGDTQWSHDPYMLHLVGQKMEFRIDRGTGWVIYTVKSIEKVDNAWHFWGAVYNKNENVMYLYKDASLENATNVFHEIEYGTLMMWNTIGAVDHGTGQNFRGTIDKLAIYDRALSAEEIQANMHRRLTGDEPNLVGYWDFDEGEGEDVCDLSGNGNDGTVVGATWVDSNAPVGICTKPELVERNISGALEIKWNILDEIEAALARENAAVDMLRELFREREYSELNKSEIGTIKQNVHCAIQEEEQSERALGKSAGKLEDSLSIMDNEAEPAGTKTQGQRK